MVSNYHTKQNSTAPPRIATKSGTFLVRADSLFAVDEDVEALDEVDNVEPVVPLASVPSWSGTKIPPNTFIGELVPVSCAAAWYCPKVWVFLVETMINQ
jgi:hypothetical protein